MTPPSSPQLERQQQLSPSVPTLPTEIIERIIKLSLPPLSFATFRERYDTLLSLVRVNSFWEQLAQRELQRHVYVDQSSQEYFEQTLSALDGLWPDPRPVTLWVTGEEYIHGEDIMDCVWAVRNLRTLRIVPRYYPLQYLDLDLLSTEASDLQELLLHAINFDDPEQSVHLWKGDPQKSLHLLQLRRLTLTRHLPNSVMSILSQSTLPQLESLLLVFQEPPSFYDPDLPGLEAAIVKHAPRLRSFGLAFLDGWDFDLSPATWSQFSRLEDLLLHPVYPLSAVLSHVPASLACLRLFAPNLWWEDSLNGLLLALTAAPAAIASLQKLVVVPLPKVSPWDADEDETWAELQAQQQTVRKWCRDRSVTLVKQAVKGFIRDMMRDREHTGEQEYSNYVEGLEALMDFWQDA